MKTWNDITLKKFYEIQEILSVQDEWTTLNLVDCIYDIESQNLTLHEISKYDISFLNEEMPKPEIKKYYTLNGTKYNSNFDLTRVSVAQFIDYQNYTKIKTQKFEDILSIFFIPATAKEYNTGYDIEKVKEDLLELPITVVTSIAFFFNRQLEIFMKIFLYFLKEEMMDMEMTPEKRLQLMNQIKILESTPLELSHLF
jgi:hypothetical protein